VMFLLKCFAAMSSNTTYTACPSLCLVPLGGLEYLLGVALKILEILA
jgi:hypothetical protein